MAQFDLVVLGGGSGGLACAQRAAEYGARVVVLEPNRLGGTCVNVGCVPKKVMWNAAELAGGLKAARDYGFDVEVRGHDFLAFKEARDAYVGRLNEIYAANLDKKKIVRVSSHGEIVRPGQVVDATGSSYEAPHIVVATGGTPRRPALEGGELGIDSDGFFELESLPERVAIIGSGYIAVELAGIFNALGSRVSIFARKNRLLRHFDSMLSAELMEQMRDDGVDIVTHAVPARLSRAKGFTLETEAHDIHAGFDEVLWAIGRSPNTSGLGLERTSVALTESGHIAVDEYQRTAEPGVYAIGDVTGHAELTPLAIAAGRRLSDRVFGEMPDRRLGYDNVPTVIFSHPPIGTVGLSEADARARYGSDTKVYTSRFVGMFHAVTEVKPRTAMKLVVAGPDERIVGCHVIGAGADEMLQGFAVAMTLGARKRDFDDTIAIHPTSAEELVTMR